MKENKDHAQRNNRNVWNGYYLFNGSIVTNQQGTSTEVSIKNTLEF